MPKVCYTASMNLGIMLDKHRKRLGMSPEQVAGTVGISRRQWDRLVKGTSSDLRMATAVRLSIALGISVESLAHADEFHSAKKS